MNHKLHTLFVAIQKLPLRSVLLCVTRFCSTWMILCGFRYQCSQQVLCTKSYRALLI